MCFHILPCLQEREREREFYGRFMAAHMLKHKDLADTVSSILSPKFRSIVTGFVLGRTPVGSRGSCS